MEWFLALVHLSFGAQQPMVWGNSDSAGRALDSVRVLDEVNRCSLEYRRGPSKHAEERCSNYALYETTTSVVLSLARAGLNQMRLSSQRDSRR